MKVFQYWAKWPDFEVTGTMLAESYSDCFREIRLRICLWNDVNYVILVAEVLE